ncbi:MAG: aldo/keto reductase [Saprospiraceae bacterium]|nr:MAG: aldo/keto reductase [Saprospiraceae bacterium]
MKKLTFTNGDAMPMLGLGTWLSKKGEVYDAIREAIKIGYRHFDCAAIYGNEPEIGDALHDAMKSGEAKRAELWITSKLWNTAHRKHQVQPALEKTLRDLRLDYLDLYLIHWPVVLKEEAQLPFRAEDFYTLDEVPVSETWEGMEAVCEKALCRHIGVANFNIKKLEKLIARATLRPELNQIEMHPLLQQKDMLEFCKQEKMHLTAYSPLGARGNPRAPGAPAKPDMFEHPVIAGIAEKHGCPPAQVMIQWGIARGTAVIPKSVNPERLRSNFEASNLQLSEEDMAGIAGLDRHYRFVTGSFWTVEGAPQTMLSLWDE